MPYSSGGGSSGGGSYSGSESGSSEHSRHRISNKPFDGARRYMYYDEYGHERYFYSKSNPLTTSAVTLVTQLIISFFAGLIGAVLIISSFSLLFGKTAPLVPVYTDYGSHIEDHAGVIDNSYELEQYLAEFRSLTGISPLVVTVYDSVWENEYTTPEDYSYDYYIQKFSDEQHWLIVYFASDNSDEWSWHAMQGNDTGGIITVSKFDRFRADLQENLEDGGVSVGGAFAVSFKNSLKYIMDDERDIIAFLIALLIGLVFAVFAVKESRSQVMRFKEKRKKYVGAILAPRDK